MKYFSVSRNTFAELFAYRLNFVLWRLRVAISILITYYLWYSIYSGRRQLFGYTSDEMFTYIVLMTLITGIVLSTQTFRIAEEINQGGLSHLLVRPLDYIRFNFFRDLADKTVNTVFSIVEVALLLLLLRPRFFIQTDPLLLLLFVLSVVIAVGIYFHISLLLSFIGFWSREVWAPRFIFFIIVAFLAGTYFPLDIVPAGIYGLLQYLPFAYLVFFPLKIYLGGLSQEVLVKGFGVSIIWLFLLSRLSILVWHRGLRSYTAEGH